MRIKKKKKNAGNLLTLHEYLENSKILSIVGNNK